MSQRVTKFSSAQEFLWTAVSQRPKRIIMII